MKNNKLKGLTLLETVLYIALFSAIMLIILTFMLSTQEATIRTQQRSSLHQASRFINQHIEYTFEEANTVNGENSLFENNNGKIELVNGGEPKSYELINNRLYYDGTLISPSNVRVENFYLQPLYKDSDIVGVRIQVQLRSTRNNKLTETINILSILR